MANFSKDEMKAKALEYLERLGVIKAYQKDFTNGKLTMFINGFGYTIDEHTEDNLLAKIREVENRSEGTVYGVVKYRLDDDTVYGLLYVSPYPEDEIYNCKQYPNVNTFNVFCYAYNATCDWCSEFGSIPVVPKFGGLSIYTGGSL